MENYSLFIGAIVIFLVVSNIAVYLFIKRVKANATEQLRNGILLSLPSLIAFTAIIIFSSFSNRIPPTSGVETSERIDTIEKAESRIDDLETHTKHLEIYLQYEQKQQLILVLGLAAIFAVPLVLIGLALY